MAQTMAVSIGGAHKIQNDRRLTIMGLDRNKLVEGRSHLIQDVRKYRDKVFRKLLAHDSDMIWVFFDLVAEDVTCAA